MGFEPMIRVLQTLALASWPRRLAERILSDGQLTVKRMSERLMFRVKKIPFQGIFRAGDGIASQRRLC